MLNGIWYFVFKFVMYFKSLTEPMSVFSISNELLHLESGNH